MSISKLTKLLITKIFLTGYYLHFLVISFISKRSSKVHMNNYIKDKLAKQFRIYQQNQTFKNMTNKIEMLSPKKEIIDHFDSLINRVDIDIDESLEKYNQEQVLNKLNCFNIGNRKARGLMSINLKRTDSSWFADEDIHYETVDEWPESTKVVDYLNRIRMRTIEELRKAQEETLEYYKHNSSQFKLNSMEEIRSELFKDKFHFQVIYKPENTKYTNIWIFNLFTFVTDFYISSTHINLLE